MTDLELSLIRHGETEWSAVGRHTSRTDLPLTAKGEEQARSLTGRLDPADFGLVLSSPRLRARHTAELAGFTGPYAPELDEDLVEWDYGDYEGKTSEEIRETVPDWTIWTARHRAASPPIRYGSGSTASSPGSASRAWSGPSASATATRCAP